MKRNTYMNAEKRSFKKSKRNGIMNVRYEILKEEKQTAGLKAAMIIIPIVIVIILLGILFFALKEFSEVSLWGNENSEAVETLAQSDDYNDESRLITVVSPDSEIPSDYELNLVSYGNIQIDSDALEPLTQLMEDAEKAGLSLEIVSGYISSSEQDELYLTEVERLITDEGYSSALAEEEAESIAPKGGFADQQTGLSILFSSAETDNFEDSAEYRWLIKNAMNYGFILRYPELKESETGMNYNPALFRYVGIENATRMRALNMCLEEYAEYLSDRDY